MALTIAVFLASRWAKQVWINTIVVTCIVPFICILGFTVMLIPVGVSFVLIGALVGDHWLLSLAAIVVTGFTVLFFVGRYFRDERALNTRKGTVNGMGRSPVSLGVSIHRPHVPLRYHGGSRRSRE